MEDVSLSVNRPTYLSGTMDKYSKGLKKGARSRIKVSDKLLFVNVWASKRVVGRFQFFLEEEECILQKQHIIEGEFYPLEICLVGLVKYLKKRKQKHIVYKTLKGYN